MTRTGSSELRTLSQHLLTREPPEIARMRTGTLPHQPGSYGQFFTTWDLANGILRDYSMNVYQLLRVAANDAVPVEAAQDVFRTMDPVYSTYLGYNGFTTLAEEAARIAELFTSDREFLVAEMAELVGYVNRLTAWSHHYFPWHFGEHCRYPDDAPAAPCAYAPSEAVPVPVGDSARRIPVRLRWEPLDLEVRAHLAGDLNEQLCAQFLDVLPFTVLHYHAVVTGESMYAWAPLVSLAPTPVTERICEAPAGRLRFSQATGNKLVVQYGPTTETLRAPVLGYVDHGYLDVLAQVGRAVWGSTFRDKANIFVTVERC